VIDLHSHILPGLDDGTRSLEEARELARQAASDGITAIAATPHVRPDYPTTVEEMEWGVDELRADFDAESIPVRVLHGAEIDLGLLWQIPREELARLTIAQTGRYLLLEFPYRSWPMALSSTVSALIHSGIIPVLAHPERNPEVQDRPARILELVELGALLQITAGSVVGGLDRAAQYAAERLLELGVVHMLASDSHGPHIARGGMPAAVEALGDDKLARYLTVDVPTAVVAGEDAPSPPQVRLSAS
jgi:protein-tyrosine phosphatase